MENGKEQSPLGRTWPQAGAQNPDPAVNAVLAPLATLAETPVSGHHAVYSALHEGLLAELNAEPSEER